MKINLKKVLTMLAILLMSVMFSACQKNINVELRLCDVDGVGNDEYGYWAICKLTDEVEDPINDVIGNIALEDGDIYTVTYIPNLDLNGGWNIADIGRIELSEPDAQAFDKALKALTGEQYTAVQVLATQVVSGLNRAYLAY